MYVFLLYKVPYLSQHLKSKSSLSLMMHHISINTSDDTLRLDVDGSYTFGEIMANILEKEKSMTCQRPPPQPLKIPITVLTISQEFDLEVETADTLDTILGMIQEKEAIRKLELLVTLRKRLLHPPHGLDDDLFYSMYWEIVLIPKLIQINVHIVNNLYKPFSVEVKRSDTIGNVKDEIFKTLLIEPFVQRLYFAGMLLEKDGAFLSDYNIHGDSTLDLTFEFIGPLDIFVEPIDGKKVSLQVSSLHKISKVKSLIREKIGLSPDHPLTLVFDGEKLDEGCKLTDYNIQDETTLFLVDDDDEKAPMMMQIHVRIVTSGETISLRVKRSDTIHDVKTMIQGMEDAIPPCNQILILPQNRLKDKSTLAEYFIRDQSTLYLLVIPEMDQNEGGFADCSVMES